MDLLESFRNTLLGELHKQFANFQAQARKEEIARNDAYDKERQIYRHEIEDLQAQVSRLEQTAAENARLRAQIEASESADKIAANVTQAEFSRVKDELEAVKADFGRVNLARAMLASKLQYRKQQLKEWNNYSRGYILKPPRKKQLSTVPKRLSPDAPAEHGVASDHPPPSYPATVITSSDSSKSALPLRRDAAVRGPKAAVDATQRSSLRRDRERKEGSEGMVETSDEETNLPTSEIGMLGESYHQRRSSAPKQIDTDGSSPIIVSERCLKRKKPSKRGAKDISIHRDPTNKVDTPTRAPLKTETTEQLPTSPLKSSRFANRQGIASDSIDLDEVVSTLWTPKKRQRLAESRLRDSAVANYARRDTPPFLQDEVEEDSSPRVVGPVQNEAILDDRPDDKINPIGMDGHTSDRLRSSTCIMDENLDSVFPEHGGNADGARRARKEAQKAEQNAHNERVHSRLTSENVKNQSSSNEANPDSQKPYRAESKLPEKPQDPRQANPFPAHRSINAALPQTSTPLAVKKHLRPPSRRGSGVAHALALAEDGDCATPVKTTSTAMKRSSKKHDKSSTTTKTAVLKALDAPSRLGNLLQYPSPPKEPLASADPAAEHIRKSRDTPTFETPLSGTHEISAARPRSVPADSKNRDFVGSRLLQTTRPSRNKHMTANTFARKGTVHGDGPADIRPEHEPLRTRPVHRLRLEDFKLNPNHSNYAFHETIRKHDDKKARGGCTDPFCQRCSELRKHAEVSGYAAPKQNGLFDSSPPEGADSSTNEKLLRDYLGSDAYRVPKMSAKEKAEAIREANKKHFMDTFGKHKQTFPKPPEMPGFWMTEFPSTQENEQFNEEIRVIERQKVEERRQEALRAGMWLFADEAT